MSQRQMSKLSKKKQKTKSKHNQKKKMFLLNKLINKLLLIQQINKIKIIRRKSTTPNLPKKKNPKNFLIECKRSEFNLRYSDVKKNVNITSNTKNINNNKFDELPLASKGWKHLKSKNDWFIIHPSNKKNNDTCHQENVTTTTTRHPLTCQSELAEAIRQLDTGGGLSRIEKLTDFQIDAQKTIDSGAHCLLAAETGCGKTLAYLMPTISRLINLKISTVKNSTMNQPQAVILVPNRELAYQVGHLAQELCTKVNLTAVTVVGGKVKRQMTNPSFDDIDLLVATPGALAKLSTVGIYRLTEVQLLILDEADTLTDDSFNDRLSNLLGKMAQAQLVLVSATLPRALPDILVPYQDRMVEVLSQNLHKLPLDGALVMQRFLRITRSVKSGNLLEQIDRFRTKSDPILIFTNKNETCKWLAQFLRENGHDTSNVSGDMSSYLRMEQWNLFVSGKTHILSTTDVSSRGLNTTNVKAVINYDFPMYMADYLHRIGRVGRFGGRRDCEIVNFVTGDREVDLVQQIEMAVRTDQPLTNVDGNISNIVKRKILRSIRQV